MTSSQAFALKAKLRRDGLIEMRLRGRCMEPFLVEGDMARVYSAETIEVGDICLVELENTEVAMHRIVSMKDNGILMKGDYSGLIEKRQFGHILGCARAIRFRDADGWADYLPSKASKQYSALLSRGIARRDEARAFPIWQKICRKLKWIEGTCLRSRYLLMIEDHPS